MLSLFLFLLTLIHPDRATGILLAPGRRIGLERWWLGRGQGISWILRHHLDVQLLFAHLLCMLNALAWLVVGNPSSPLVDFIVRRTNLALRLGEIFRRMELLWLAERLNHGFIRAQPYPAVIDYLSDFVCCTLDGERLVQSWLTWFTRCCNRPSVLRMLWLLLLLVIVTKI